MANGIDIVIGGEVSGALAAMTAVEQRTLVLQSRIAKLQQVAGTTQNIDKMNRSLMLLSKTQNELSRISAKNSFAGITKGSSEATASMVNLSRVVQDAPYGFIGIANNLNPLLESFQRLKVSTGTTGGALKALGSSLTGAGGIGLALGLVTTAITFATSGFGAWTRGLFGAKKGADDLSASIAALAQQASDAKDNFKSFEDQVKFLERLGAVTVDFNFEQGFERDILKLRQKSVNLDTEIFDGEKTLKKLEDVYQQSWKFYEEEGSRALTDLSTQFSSFRVIPDAAIDELGSSDKAIAQQLKKSAQDVYDFQISLDKKREDRTIARANIRVALAEDERKRQKEALEKQKDDYDKYVSETISRGKELAAFFEGRRIVPTFGIFDTKGEQFKKALKVIKDFNAGSLGIIFRPIIPIEPQFKIENGYVEREVTKRFKSLDKGSGLLGKDFEPVLRFSPQFEMDKKYLSDIEKYWNGIFDGMSNTIFQTAVDAFSGIGEGIGAALAGGGIQEAFQGVANALASGFQALGKQMIAAAPIIAALKTAINSLNPAILLPAGIGLVAIGAALKGAMSSGFGGFRAAGGPVGQGQSYVVGENGPELFVPANSGRIMNGNQIAAMSYSGGGSSGGGRQIIRGQNIILAYARTNRAQNRLGRG